jgi:hypothetical protein
MEMLEAVTAAWRNDLNSPNVAVVAFSIITVTESMSDGYARMLYETGHYKSGLG